MLSWLTLKPTRLALLLVVSSLVAACGWLWWNATTRSELNFLPKRSGATWIVYPKSPSGGIHRNLELHSDFRKTFVLDAIPDQAYLKISAFHYCSISLNGHVLNDPLQHGRNWKFPDVFAVPNVLRPGTNELSVTVFNTNGPSALWLLLKAGNFALKSDETWEASYMGSPWLTARSADSPASARPGNPLYGGDKPSTAFGKRWPILLLFACLSACIYFVMEKGKGARLQETKSKVKEWLPIAAFAGLWVALFVNNLPKLPILTGYDAAGHMDYIDWIQERHSLPLASDGWEMFQPPLYYILCATLLNATSLTVRDPTGIMLLRIFGLVVGIVHFAIVWKSLRLLRLDRAGTGFGLLLAACLPPVIFLAQYVSNEAFAAALVSVCIYLCLRILTQERGSWKSYIGLGLCLGAAMLAKVTAILAFPPIFAALIWKATRNRARVPDAKTSNRNLRFWAMDLALILVCLAICVLVSGWHYVRVWRHFGNPFIGVWDPKSGFLWWQDTGYRTSAFYLHFGQALVQPWFSALTSFADGIYSTLWGDGLVGGLDFDGPPPWNHELMAIGYWLAIIPTVVLVVGTVRAVRGFLRQPTAEWFLILAFGFLVAFATIYLSIAVPYFCAVKAFYALPALIPFCALGALGLGQQVPADFDRKEESRDSHSTNPRKLRRVTVLVCYVLMGTWAMNAFASFWILRASPSTLLARGKSLMREQRFEEAASLLKQGLALSTENRPLQFQLTQALAETLTQSGNLSEGISKAKVASALQPENGQPHALLGNIFNAKNLLGQAIAEYERALLLQPELPEVLNNLAWIWATSPDEQSRNGAEAVRLAERACQISEYKEPMYVGTLAAAYAEARRFDDAVKTAVLARDLARATGQKDLAEKNQELSKLFAAHEPYRETRK